MQQYNDDWRQKRKLVSQEFTATAVPKYHVMQEKQARLLVQNLVKDPSTFVPELQLYVSHSSPCFFYLMFLNGQTDRFYDFSCNIRVLPRIHRGSPFPARPFKYGGLHPLCHPWKLSRGHFPKPSVIRDLFDNSETQSCLVKYVPSWFPGAGFKKYATVCRKRFQDATWVPFLWSKKALVSSLFSSLT